MVKITLSEKRNPKPQVIKIGENIKITTWGAIKVNRSHFFPSSFQVKSDEKIIFIDPVEVDPSEKADYILITHSHPDHFSLKDIKRLLKSGTEIICSKSVTKKLEDFNNQVLIMTAGDILKLEGMNLEATAAYNTKSVFLWIKAHPKSKENIGYILTLSDGLRIYHAGDTDYIPEMNEIKNIQLAFIPVGGDNLTMNEDEAAMVANQIKPEKVVPIHYEIKNSEVLKRFRSLVDKSIQVIEIE
ncbi:MAG: MBL fold metallo-hydrolase [Bacteroidales bacterium]|nr:MBL fold metallo-hydrolase [Bacteroidales bacterium]